MTASTPVEIHEFSTGIRPERTADGGWVSRGFTGQYMNVTIPEIPNAVERSIANKEFAVAEGASSEQPAVIGRVVGSDESAWSVVAIVTRGRDEKGRSASLYRYFLCLRDDSLPKILAWIEEQRRNGRMPVFDPFETKVAGSPNISYVPTPQLSLSEQVLQSWIFSDPAPVIIEPGQYNEQSLDKLATEKAKTNGQPVAWAFNVEALEQPGRFQIIQAASPRAYTLLQRAKDNTPQNMAPVITDEQAIKSAIKGLINSSTAKPEYVEAIANSLENTQIDERYWRYIFDDWQGADKALKQGIYSPQMVRLLMLRAIVIPETLPDYLAWLKKGTKQNEPYTVAAEFDSQLSRSLKQIPAATTQSIEFKIREGVKILLLKLLAQNELLESSVWLLTSTNGLWIMFYRQVVQDMESDLHLIGKSSKRNQNSTFHLTDKTWQSIWSDIEICWRTSSYKPKQKYQVFAELFGQLSDYKLSACFYAISFGEVPKEIFTEACPNARFRSTVYNLLIQRKVTILEMILIILSNNILLISIFALILLLTTGTIVAVKLFLLKSKASSNHGANTASVASEQNKNSFDNISSNKNPVIKTQNFDKKKAISKFETTRKAITMIVVDISKKSETDKKEIKNKVLKILSEEGLDYELFDKSYLPNKEQQESWVQAIGEYQERNNIPVDGVIEVNHETSKLLQCDVAKSLIGEEEALKKQLCIQSKPQPTAKPNPSVTPNFNGQG